MDDSDKTFRNVLALIPAGLPALGWAPLDMSVVHLITPMSCPSCGCIGPLSQFTMD